MYVHSLTGRSLAACCVSFGVSLLWAAAAHGGDLPMGKLASARSKATPTASSAEERVAAAPRDAIPDRVEAAAPARAKSAPKVAPFRTRLWDALVNDADPDSEPPQWDSSTANGSSKREGTNRDFDMPTFQPNGYIRNSGGVFRLVKQPAAPVQPLQPLAPPQPLAPVPALGALQTFGQGGPQSALEAIPEGPRREQVQSILPVASATSAPALSVNARPDLAQAISDQDLAVQTMWRGSVSEAPFIRGFKNRQIYAQLDGQYFEPVRWDLDTITNKIDPGIVQDVIVVQGPYAVQYGPGFTFMDIVTRPTPRNQATQYRTSMSWIPNGQQIYARETISGGSQDFGYRFSYGHRNANDYQAGNRSSIASHYNMGDVLAELGYNLSSSQRIEGQYRRQDMNHTAYPGQFFDVSSLETNAYNLRYIDENITAPWTRLTVQGWYNNNNMTGNTFNESQQPVVSQVQNALTNYYYVLPPGASPVGLAGLPTPATPLVGFSGGTVGYMRSTGGRAIAQFGELDEVSLTTGADFRVLNQQVLEQFTIAPFVGLPGGGVPPGTPIPPAVPGLPGPPFTTHALVSPFSTGMPAAQMINPGAFAEMTLPWTPYFRTKIGGRGDYVNTNAYPGSLPGNFSSSFGPGTVFNQNNGLYAFYMVNQVDITRHWSAALSFGQAQRPPSLIDRYADGMFLGIIQSGFRRVIGDPNLAPERNWQIDAQINGNYENWRGFLRGYNSWVNNYITYSQNLVPDPTGATLLTTLNTPQAQLRGFEAFNSLDVAPRVTPFASARYVYGEDVTIHQALTQIPPLQGFAGIRFHDPNGGRRWGLEVFATMTQVQNRVGVLRITGLGDTIAPTPIERRVGGWTIASMRGYWNVSQNVMLSGGINNIFNRNYIQYLSLQSGNYQVLSPGISPYMSLEWIY